MRSPSDCIADEDCLSSCVDCDPSQLDSCVDLFRYLEIESYRS